ncbi:UNVERIFIED_CONTAM: Caffeic acid 3-O-methyltransferase 2 [Sesamum radiatum]|uniref:Caffeic acid 3-O-methyltransferase 2 n=1 Tax=Sesamum radiatum TaxID=300843 RepID=A0AAW2PXR8_SESRA
MNMKSIFHTGIEAGDGSTPSFSLKDAVLEGGSLTERIHGKSNYEYVLSDPAIIKLLCEGMEAYSTLFMRKAVKEYDGFSNLGLIVDVGGCTGTTLGIIVAEYPHIKGINLIYQRRRAYWWDMFVEVPKGDHLTQDKGKLIVMDSILPNNPQTDVHTKYTSGMDIIQLTSLEGKERTKDEFETLATKAGFVEFKAVYYVYGQPHDVETKKPYLSNGVSLAQLRALTGRGATEFSLKDAVLEGRNLTERIHGKSNYELIISNPETLKVMHDGMTAHSTTLMKKTIKIYDGFSSFDSIVDVGGGTGTTLGIIVAKYPHIKGINFDLPQVVQHAPSYNGVEHIGGDMFVEVPKGDAILLEFILHNWNDEKCIKLLKNCYEALSDKGKLIVMDSILSNNPQTNDHAKYASGMDIIMLTNLEGKERTKDEFETLATKAGFAEFKIICYVYGMWIMELMKSV